MTGITSSSNTSPSDYRIVTVWLNRWSLEIEVGQSGAACIANPATARVEAIVLYTKHKRSIELRFRRPNCISHRNVYPFAGPPAARDSHHAFVT